MANGECGHKGTCKCLETTDGKPLPPIRVAPRSKAGDVETQSHAVRAQRARQDRVTAHADEAQISRGALPVPRSRVVACRGVASSHFRIK